MKVQLLSKMELVKFGHRQRVLRMYIVLYRAHLLSKRRIACFSLRVAARRAAAAARAPQHARAHLFRTRLGSEADPGFFFGEGARHPAETFKHFTSIDCSIDAPAVTNLGCILFFSG